MWKKINQQTYYTVDFKTDKLIEKAVVALDHHLVVLEIRIEVVEGYIGAMRLRIRRSYNRAKP